MNINVNVKDRLTLIGILPSTGKMVDLVEIIALIKLLKFTEQEKLDINYREENGRITWDITKDQTKDVDINFEQIKIIKAAIEDLDKAGKVDLMILDTCLKFSKL